MRGRVSLVTILAAASCSSPHPESRTAATPAPVRAVTERVSAAMLPIVYRATGTVQARTRSVLSAQVAGSIRQVMVEAGQAVRSGQTLVVIDARDLEAGSARAEAARQEARSALPETERAIESAEAQLALARATHARMKELHGKRSISQQEMDEAEARLRHAQAGAAMAQARRDQVLARIAQTEQGVASARINTGYATVTAPFDGLVAERHAEPGAMAFPGMPLVAIERAGAFRLEVAVEESRAGGVRPGMPVRVVFDDGLSADARISEIVPALDPATRTLSVRADLPALPGLRSGRFARAEWTAGERRTLTVAAAAVRESGQMQMVYVVEQGRIRSRAISAGETAGGRREVLAGLREGEMVVTAPSGDIADGAPVESGR